MCLEERVDERIGIEGPREQVSGPVGLSSYSVRLSNKRCVSGGLLPERGGLDDSRCASLIDVADLSLTVVREAFARKCPLHRDR